VAVALDDDVSVVAVYVIKEVEDSDVVDILASGCWFDPFSGSNLRLVSLIAFDYLFDIRFFILIVLWIFPIVRPFS